MGGLESDKSGILMPSCDSLYDPSAVFYFFLLRFTGRGSSMGIGLWDEKSFLVLREVFYWHEDGLRFVQL